MTLTEPLRLSADEHPAPWGGSRLTGRPGVGELWAAHGGSVISEGRHEGATLADLCSLYGPELLGCCAGPCFPLIVKLLDTADWLSVQVHPDDAGAVRFEGPGVCGKTEAWHILDAAPGAEIVVGARAGASAGELRASLCCGDPLAALERRPVHAGDSVLIRAGTIHTMSGGVLAYEVQQASNTTYRAYDWDRGRELHPDRFWKTADARLRAVVESPGFASEVVCEHFRMTLRSGESVEPLRGTFQLVTAIEGEAVASGEGWSARIASLETIVIPACLGAYVLAAEGRAVVAAPGDSSTSTPG